MSKVVSAPRCTPPIPPVAKTAMPARAATAIVAATVVLASDLATTTAERSRRDALRTPVALPSRSSASAVSPTLMRPPRTAIVAGTAPASRMAASTARAVSTF